MINILEMIFVKMNLILINDIFLFGIYESYLFILVSLNEKTKKSCVFSKRFIFKASMFLKTKDQNLQMTKD
jgi:uncharacterized protein YktB (UPF0637 family)